MSTTQSPRRFIAHDGGRTLTSAQANEQWLAAWSRIAAACEQGLSELHPQHPRRPDLLAMTRDARAAASLPSVRPA